MTFDQIKRLKKRADYFVPAKAWSKGDKLEEPPSWPYPLGDITPDGMGIAATNYSLMQDEADTHLDKLLWLDATARSFNRFIDRNRIEGDDNAKRCLSWWRVQLTIDPRFL